MCNSCGENPWENLGENETVFFYFRLMLSLSSEWEAGATQSSPGWPIADPDFDVHEMNKVGPV